MALALLPAGAEASGYRRAPDPIPRMLGSSPRLPRALPDPTGRHVLLAERAPRPRDAGRGRSVAEGPGALPGSRARRGLLAPFRSGSGRTGFVLRRVGTSEERRIAPPEGLGEDPVLGPPIWSPNGRRIAFTVRRSEGIELWVAEVEGARRRRLVGPVLHQAFGRPCRWMPDARHLLCRREAEEREPSGAPSALARALLGPIALGPEPSGTSLETPAGARAGGWAPGLRSVSGPSLASRLVLVDAATGDVRPLGPAGVLERARPSPNGAYLLVSRIAEPRSLLVDGPPARGTELWDAAGRRIRRLAGAPGSRGESDRAAARGFRWAAGEPATLVWPERIAGSATPRDRLVRLAAPFADAPSEILRLRGRFAGLGRIPAAGALLVHGYERRTRRRRTWLVAPKPAEEGAEAGEARLLWERSVDDDYADPGAPLRVASPSARRVVASHEGAIFLAGRGARPEGTRPFLDRLDLETLESERLWQSSEGRHERVTDAVSPEAGLFLVRHESPVQPPNYALLRLGGEEGGASMRGLTAIDAPRSPLRNVRRRALRYERADGVPLAGTLHVPAEREEGERLPLVVWIYPRKHASAETAGQSTGSPRSYVALEGVSPLPLTTQGFAVLTAAMPVIGDSEKANDDFTRQTVGNAEAAVRAAVASGVADADRVAIAGHSYGAFAAVSLLARTDLFEAGVALSGAYNRTLTPFGFQSEHRTLWEAPETYLEMSPLLRAHRIRAPLLLVHGERDAHPGTPPEQSALLYRAIRETGGTARLVLLPQEGHVYRSREARLHAYAEIVAWLERHLKGARDGPAEDAPRRAGSAQGKDPSG